jgi:hypothetical protein
MTDYRADLEESEIRHQRADLVYRLMVESDTTEIEGYIEEFIKRLTAKFHDRTLSTRFKTVADEAIHGKDRHLKQAFFFFYLFVFKDFAESLIDDQNPKVPPTKFKNFYDNPNNLSMCCKKYLGTEYVSLRQFVIEVRNSYFMA